MRTMQKLLKATAIMGYGMVSETVTHAKKIKPNKFMGCYLNKPTAKAYIKLDRDNPLDLKKSRFVLLLDSNEILNIKNSVELKTIQVGKREHWYQRYTIHNKFILVFRSNDIRKQIHNVCTKYSNCKEISKVVCDSLDVASARYYDLMKKNKAFPGQKNVI